MRAAIIVVLGALLACMPRQKCETMTDPIKQKQCLDERAVTVAPAVDQAKQAVLMHDKNVKAGGYTTIPELSKEFDKDMKRKKKVYPDNAEVRVLVVANCPPKDVRGWAPGDCYNRSLGLTWYGDSNIGMRIPDGSKDDDTHFGWIQLLFPARSFDPSLVHGREFMARCVAPPPFASSRTQLIKCVIETIGAIKS